MRAKKKDALVSKSILSPSSWRESKDFSSGHLQTALSCLANCSNAHKESEKDPFLDASSHLYKPVNLSVDWSVSWLVGWLVGRRCLSKFSSFQVFFVLWGILLSYQREIVIVDVIINFSVSLSPSLLSLSTIIINIAYFVFPSTLA